MKRTIFSLVLFAPMIMQSSCGKKAAAKQQIPDLIDIPTYPVDNEGLFSLNPKKTAIGYGGTMALFNKEADPTDIADLLQASINSRIAWGEATRFSEEVQYNLLFNQDSGIYLSAVEDMRMELVRFTTSVKSQTPLPDETLQATADQWWAAELNVLFGEGESPEKQEADLKFGQYCDNKLMELATNSLFAATTYKSRPTPLAFCEPYYASRNYFTGPLCEDNAAGQEYFTCVWREGFAKSKIYEHFSEDQKLTLNGLLADGTIDNLRGVFALDLEVLIFEGSRGERLKDVVLGKERDNLDYYSSPVMGLSAFRGSTCSRTVPADVLAMCTDFALSLSGSTLPLKTTPIETISNFEGKGSPVLPDRPDSEFSTAQVLSYIAERRSHRNSENDRLFHKLASGKALEQPEYPASFMVTRSKIEDYFTDGFYPSLTGTDLEFYNKKTAEINFLEEQIELMQEEYVRLEQQISLTSLEGFRIGHRPNLTHALFEGALKITNHDNILRAYFNIKTYDPFHVVIGCFDLSNGTNPENCLPHPDDGINTETITTANMFQVNQNTGLVELEIKIVDPENMGFLKIERKDQEDRFESFSDFDAAYYLNKNLYFELFPNVIYEHLDILTGKAFFRDDQGNDLEEAAVSFWNQNQ